MIAKAFRIFDFRSIHDSFVCPLSADGITVLAGQNESGKTSVLSALRDFDLEREQKPQTPEYQPEGRWDAKPRVSVQFQVDVSDISRRLAEDESRIPEAVIKAIAANPLIWVTRDLESGQFSLGQELSSLWSEEILEEQDGEEEDSADPASEIVGSIETALTAADFASFLRNCCPNFIYFDSFDGCLPRQVAVADLTEGKSPQSVRDFVTLSGLDLKKLSGMSSQDKVLGNYLDSCSATITGDFLTYWKTKSGRSARVDLRVRHVRNESGDLHLAFYIRDQVDQFPEQRSKGFLWFLSFYLRLAAAQLRSPGSPRLLLIDEPGSYLHARAQQDVVQLFEERLAKQDQIIYSTHSQHLLPIKNLHRLRVVIKTEEEGTVVLDRLTHPLLRGGAFSDTLSPLIAAIGIDVRQGLVIARERNVLVEGISDSFYLISWASLYWPSMIETVNVFPGHGASTLPLLASLFIGWGLEFVVLLDRDKAGREAADRLCRGLALPESAIVFPQDAVAIEDLLSAEDFRAVLFDVDPGLTLAPNERPSDAIKRQRIDKVLLARRFSERQASSAVTLTAKTEKNIRRLLSQIEVALGKKPLVVLR